MTNSLALCLVFVTGVCYAETIQVERDSSTQSFVSDSVTTNADGSVTVDHQDPDGRDVGHSEFNDGRGVSFDANGNQTETFDVNRDSVIIHDENR